MWNQLLSDDSKTHCCRNVWGTHNDLRWIRTCNKKEWISQMKQSKNIIMKNFHFEYDEPDHYWLIHIQDNLYIHFKPPQK